MSSDDDLGWSLAAPRREMRFTAASAAQLWTPMGTPLAAPPAPDLKELDAAFASAFTAAAEHPDTGGGRPATRMAVVDGVVRHRVILEVTKIKRAERTTIRRLLPDPEAELDRVYLDVLGANRDDDDPEFPAGTLAALDGATVFYSLMVSDPEARELDDHPNATVHLAPLVAAL